MPRLIIHTRNNIRDILYVLRLSENEISIGFNGSFAAHV